MALVAGQDVEQDDDGTWKIAQRVAPDRMISTVDPEARHMRKSRSEYRDGYKAHIAIEPETGLVTKAILTKANVVDGRCASALVADEDPGLMVLGDTAYASGETLAALGQPSTDGHQALAVQGRVPGGFERDDFVIDHDAGTATCPAGHTVTITPHLNAVFPPTVAGAHCERCTTAHRGRKLELTPHDKELVALRASWREVISKGIIDDSARWSSVRLRGWSPMLIAGCASEESRGISSDFHFASPLSTSGG